MEDPVASRNFQALKKKSYDIKFELEGTSYDPIENIGIGAYGVVCSAVHRKTRDKVAIKKIPSIFEQPTIAKRTYREIKILKHFKHDNIIAIREILKPPESTSEFKDVYIVLDLMESDLHRIIYSKQELSDEHVRYFLYQILRGLKYIHSANVIHRDLKPSNLLINENCDLKIGDFGMARGVSDKANEYNMMMTQYVATRWYRAPELIMLPTNYSAAVDMWSVGCILAEMLGKRQLFPGQNYMHQIKLIIGILGAPSPKFLKQINSDMLKMFIGGLGRKEPVPLKKLYPKAPNKAVDLLGKMLSLDPDNRITVEQALVHLYLNKYHDPDDEPVCVPVFNFDFEKQKFEGTQLRDSILKEIMDYHQPPRGKVFNLRPVPKAELKSPTSPKPPKVESKGENSSGLDAFLKYMNEQGGFKKPVAAQSETTETLEQQLQLSVESLQQLQSNMATGTQLAPHQDQDGFLKPTGIPVQSKRPPKLSTKTSKPSIEGERSSTDVEMMSAKSSAKSDVEMLSAKSQDQPLDAKAQLKAALLEAHLRRQRNEASGEKIRPVTAQQRQKEREEKRRKKLERVQEKKRKEKKKGKDNSKLLLTDEDKSMLERWKNMQKQPTNASASKSVSSDMVPPATPDAASTVHDQSLATQDQQIRNRIQNLGLQDQSTGGIQQTPDPQLRTQDHTQQIQDQQLHTSSSDPALQDRHSLTVTQDQMHSLPQDSNSHRQGFPEMSDMNMPNLQVRSSAGLATGYESFSHASFLPSESHLQDGLQAAPPGPGYFSQGSTTKLLKDNRVNAEPKTQALFGTPKTDSQPVLPEIGPSYNLPTVTGPWPQLAPLVSEPGETRLPTYDEAIQARAGQPMGGAGADTVQHMMGASSYPCDPLLDNLSYPNMGVGPNTSYQNAPSTSTAPPHTLGGSQGQSSPELLNSLSRLLWKSHVEDLTLAQTPKGTGGGYGVGLDLDEVLRDPVNNPPHDECGGDSAPLSASLIADWLEVSGNMDPKDLEALQQELGLTSPSAFSGILSS